MTRCSSRIAKSIAPNRTMDDLVHPDLNKTAPGSIEFGGRAKVLKELVEHHVEGEEGEMFPRSRKSSCPGTSWRRPARRSLRASGN